MSPSDQTSADVGSGDLLADRRADYAAELARAGDPAAAADLMRQALEIAPGWVAGWVALGTHLGDAADAAGAADAYRRALALDPQDGQGAGLHLAVIEGRTPSGAPPAFVKRLFDQYAPRFEASLLEKLDYAAPRALAAAILDGTARDARFSRVLDLGCGTGLMGAELRTRCDRLEGIDLSPGMLALARLKGIYDALAQADILALPAYKVPFDLVTAADVFNYVGDLRPAFGQIAKVLAPGGRIAFTVEAEEGPAPFRLREALRFAHDPRAVAELGKENGWTVEIERSLVLRTDRGVPVEGVAFVFRAPDESACF